MAKVKIILSYILCFLAFNSAFGQSYLSKAKHESPRQKLRQTYLSQVGVKEQGGANRGKMVEQYLAVTKLGPGYAWCAAFVSWCFVQADIEAPVSAWVPSFSVSKNLIYKRGELLRKIPQEGDVFQIWFSNLKRPAHIGFIEKWDGGTVITVEGNTNTNGSREGDGVYRKRRLVKQIWAVYDFLKDVD